MAGSGSTGKGQALRGADVTIRRHSLMADMAEGAIRSRSVLLACSLVVAAFVAAPATAACPEGEILEASMNNNNQMVTSCVPTRSRAAPQAQPAREAPTPQSAPAAVQQPTPESLAGTYEGSWYEVGVPLGDGSCTGNSWREPRRATFYPATWQNRPSLGMRKIQWPGYGARGPENRSRNTFHAPLVLEGNVAARLQRGPAAQLDRPQSPGRAGSRLRPGMPALRRNSRDFLGSSGPALGASSITRGLSL